MPQTLEKLLQGKLIRHIKKVLFFFQTLLPIMRLYSQVVYCSNYLGHILENLDQDPGVTAVFAVSDKFTNVKSLSYGGPLANLFILNYRL